MNAIQDGKPTGFSSRHRKTEPARHSHTWRQSWKGIFLHMHLVSSKQNVIYIQFTLQGIDLQASLSTFPPSTLCLNAHHTRNKYLSHRPWPHPPPPGHRRRHTQLATLTPIRPHLRKLHPVLLPPLTLAPRPHPWRAAPPLPVSLPAHPQIPPFPPRLYYPHTLAPHPPLPALLQPRRHPPRRALPRPHSRPHGLRARRGGRHVHGRQRARAGDGGV